MSAPMQRLMLHFYIIYIYVHLRAHPYLRGTFVGVPRIRFIAFLGLYWGPPIAGSYHVGYELEHSIRLSVW